MSVEINSDALDKELIPDVDHEDTLQDLFASKKSLNKTANNKTKRKPKKIQKKVNKVASELEQKWLFDPFILIIQFDSCLMHNTNL
jgi:hypothetical protein